MSLLDEASLLVTPNAEKATKLYSIIPTNGNGDFSVTRATTATRTNASGLIENSPINEPRIDYSLGSCPNILLEPQRTNLALRSEEFNDATWTKGASTITANTTTAPSGISNADTFTADGTSNRHDIFQTVSLVNGTTLTWSIYAKKGTNNFIQFGANDSNFGATSFANFDLNNGVVGSVGGSFLASIQNVGNGWYRCIVTATTNISGNISFRFILVTSATAARLEVNTLSTSVFLWGAQIEVGAYATSYIPTTSASVTRNADVISRGNIFTNGLITASGGTWFVDLRGNIAKIRDNSGAMYLGVDANNCFRIRNISAALLRFTIDKNIAGISTNLFTTTTDNVKLAIKWNGATADVFVNGVKVVSETAFTFTALQDLISSAGIPLNINSMALFPTPLTDTQCIALTT